MHGSGTIWSFTKVVMALGPAQGMYSMKPWQLGAGTDRVASDLDVSAHAVANIRIAIYLSYGKPTLHTLTHASQTAVI